MAMMVRMTRMANAYAVADDDNAGEDYEYHEEESQ